MNIQYTAFDKFVLRRPLLSLSEYRLLTKGKNITFKAFKNLFQNPKVKEGIFLASPSLVDELNKWMAGEPIKPEIIKKLEYALLKYLSRMSSRCTPFGLFAGCGIGKSDASSNLQSDLPEEIKRHTRLDMNYLISLTQNISNLENVKKQLLFFPNNSIYEIGTELRYIEYKYINGKRKHHIASVDSSIYLKKILKLSQRGLLLEDIASLIVDNNVSIDESRAFIEELVKSQLLISELEPSISGPDVLTQVIQILEKLNGTDGIIKILRDVNASLQKIDENIGNSLDKYSLIRNKLNDLGVFSNEKYLFQTDMFFDLDRCALNKGVFNSVLRGMVLFNKITLINDNTSLEKFKKSFFERYNDREIEVSKALDVETGVGYKKGSKDGCLNPLIDDLAFPIQDNGNKVYKLSKIDFILNNKIAKAISGNKQSVIFTEDDFKDLSENWDNLPDTFSTIIEVINVDGIEKIKCSGMGGSSAGNTLGRFCNEHPDIKKHTQNIADIETKINKDKVIAEIIHLPQARTGNILMRPMFRNFEIPYLSKSLKDPEFQINVSDLHISIRRNCINLKSKKLNKDVIPRLTNAHNFTSDSLPVYHFLCDMQTQNKREHIGLFLGPYVNEYSFIPRIEYENLILAEAFWNIQKTDIMDLITNIDNDNQLIKEVKIFRKMKKIHQYVLLKDGDNELLINFKNLTSVRMLLNTIKMRKSFRLKEFIFSSDDNFKSQNFCTNEIVLSFYNKIKLND